MKNRMPYTVAGLLCCCLVLPGVAQERAAARLELDDLSAQIQERRRAKALSQEARQLRKDALVAEEEYAAAESTIPQVRRIDEEIGELTRQIVTLRRERREELEKHAKKLEKEEAKRSRISEELRSAMSDDAETQALVAQQRALFEAQMEATVKQSKKEEDR